VKLRGLIAALLVLAVQACAKQAGPREPNPKNELPFGYLDFPMSGAMVEREMPANGWAMDDGSVTDILIYLDNHFIARTTLTEKRADVSKAYPQYAHGGDKHGWGILVPLGGDAKLGPHTILVQAVDDQGATRDIGMANIELTR
jgi:hypothetical protein